MTTVTGLTADRMLEIEAASVVDGEVISGNLILTQHGGSTINAGPVVGPQGPQGPAGATGPSGSETIGTSFPVSPIDGQKHILVDSLSAPTWAWTFRYVATITDAYKWVFMGGSPLVVVTGVATPEFNTPASTWQQITDPDVVVPRSGIYRVAAWCQFGANIANKQVFFGVCNASVNMDPIGVQAGVVIVNYDTAVLDVMVSVNGGNTLRQTMQGQSVVGGYRSLSIVPRRVS